MARNPEAIPRVAESEPLVELLDSFDPRFQEHITAAMLWRLGLASPGDEADRALVRSLEHILVATGGELHRFFHDAFASALPDSYCEAWTEFRALAAAHPPRKERGAYWDGEPCGMLIDEVEAIWAPVADNDDWSLLHAKVAEVRALGEALA